MKKAHLSPATSLLVSFSLALGILVSGLSNSRLLPAAHAQTGSCSSPDTSTKITEAVALNGIEVRALFVNGEVVAQGVIAGAVRIVDSRVVNGNGVGGGPNSHGALVGGGAPSASGALVGGGVISPTGALVGGGVISPTGALVGGGIISPTGALVGGGSPCGDVLVFGGGVGRANGGMLTGDDIMVNDGVITGENLVLIGSIIHGGGRNTAVQISPAN